jgi:hypothetical protein
MAYGAVQHSAARIKAAFWRGAPKGMNKRVSIRVEIGRSMRQRLPWWAGPKDAKGPVWKSRVKSLGPGYSARACIVGGRERRCTYAEGRSPTLAFKSAVRKLLKKTR